MSEGRVVLINADRMVSCHKWLTPKDLPAFTFSGVTEASYNVESDSSSPRLLGTPFAADFDRSKCYCVLPGAQVNISTSRFSSHKLMVSTNPWSLSSWMFKGEIWQKCWLSRPSGMIIIWSDSHLQPCKYQDSLLNCLPGFQKIVIIMAGTDPLKVSSYTVRQVFCRDYVKKLS